MKYIGGDGRENKIRSDIFNAFDYEVDGRVISRVLKRVWNGVDEIVGNNVTRGMAVEFYDAVYNDEVWYGMK